MQLWTRWPFFFGLLILTFCRCWSKGQINVTNTQSTMPWDAAFMNYYRILIDNKPCIIWFILDEYWSNHPELHDIPIYYASSLAKKCMSVYQTYINAMNEKIRKQITVSNPFVFRHISNLKVRYNWREKRASVQAKFQGLTIVMRTCYIVGIGYDPATVWE